MSGGLRAAGCRHRTCIVTRRWDELSERQRSLPVGSSRSRPLRLASRRVASIIFPNLKLKDRKPIVLSHVPAVSAAGHHDEPPP